MRYEPGRTCGITGISPTHTHTETHIVSHQVICPTIALCDELKNEAAQVCSSRSDLVILYCQSHTHL